MIALQVDENETVEPSDSHPPTETSLKIYRRIAFGRKFLFAPCNSDGGKYFLVNPTPHKHASSWKPIFYRGDNPKYTPTSKAIARLRRTKMWNSFRVQFGDGTDEVLENKRRVKERRSYEKKKKLRIFFRLEERPPKKELEDPQDVHGFFTEFKMRRSIFMARSVKWEFAGEKFRWTGTRAFQSSPFRRWKGMSHDLKLVDSNNKLIATVQKDRWASFRRSEKTGAPPNKKKSFVGTLRILPEAYKHAAFASLSSLGQGCSHITATDVHDELSWNMGKPGSDQMANVGGHHSGNMIEELIVLTGWTVLEAEHRLRYKILDVLEEIAEEFQE